MATNYLLDIVILLAVLLLQDLAVVPLLTLVPLLAIPEPTIGADIAIALAEGVAILRLVVVGGHTCCSRLCIA